MNSRTSFTLVYATADVAAQSHLATELGALGRLGVEIKPGDNHFQVVIQNRSEATALAVHELVMSIDSHAELIETHDGAHRTDEPSDLAEARR